MQQIQEEEIDAAVAEQRAAEQALVQRAVARCARTLLQREHLKSEVARLVASGDTRLRLWCHDFHSEQHHLARQAQCVLELTPMDELQYLPKTLRYDAPTSVLENVRTFLPAGYAVMAYTNGNSSALEDEAEARVSLYLFGPGDGGGAACTVS